MKHVINNPGGRKKLSAEKLMGNPIPVRFNLRQRTRLEMKAAKANMPLSVYLREAGLKVVVCKGARNLAEIRETITLLAAAAGVPAEPAEAVE